MIGIKRHTAGRPRGAIVVAGAGATIERDTLQCCHCGGHWVVEPGSGRRRGWCFKCGQPTCGSPACDECVPVEQRLEMIEKA